MDATIKELQEKIEQLEKDIRIKKEFNRILFNTVEAQHEVIKNLIDRLFTDNEKVESLASQVEE